jgi:aconitase A
MSAATQAEDFAINVVNRLPPGVTAKDLILAIIGKIGVSGGTGHVFEFRGPAISSMSMDERMTMCNMSIEAGARAGMIAPDATTFAYLEKPRARPKGAAWDAALERWKKLPTDAGAAFDRSVEIDAASLVPMVTYGTHPGMVAPITGNVPAQGDAVFQKALAYMGLKAGEPIRDVPVNNVFVGSCTNGRLSDLRNAARVLRGHKLAKGVKMLVVPGSQNVKRAAEAEGLDRIFLDAGAEWRESGCSMCLGMNGDLVPSGHYSSAPAIAISKAARASVRAPCWPVPRPPPPRPSRTRHRSAGIHKLKCQPLPRFAPARSCCPRPTSTPDQIIPGALSHRDVARRIRKHLFADWRYERCGQSEAGFRAQQARSEGRQVLVSRTQYRLCSSREHAAWALLDFGIHAVISTEFADIFRPTA